MFRDIQGSVTSMVTLKVQGHSRFRDIQGYIQSSGTSKVTSRFMDIQGSGTFKVHGHLRFRDIQGSGTFKVQGHPRLRSRFWFVQGYVQGYVHEVVLACDTGRGRIDSGSEIGTRHGVWYD